MIRLATESDRKSLLDFLVLNNGERNRELATRYIKSMFSLDYRHPNFFVKEDSGGVIIGAAAFSEELFTVGVWGISWVSVHPDHRHQGLGAELMNACLNEIKQRAGRTVTVILATYPDKTGLYDKLGFTKAIQDHDDGWIMTKTLTS